MQISEADEKRDSPDDVGASLRDFRLPRQAAIDKNGPPWPSDFPFS